MGSSTLRSRLGGLIAWALILGAAAARAQWAHRVSDINPGTWTRAWGGVCGDSDWRVTRGFPGVVLADATGAGCGIYGVADSSGGLDLIQGPAEFGGRGGVLGRAGPLVYFEYWTETTESQIWRTDGTKAGTHPLQDLGPDPRGVGTWSWFEAAEPASYFGRWTEATGHELWATDGTPAGTRMVRDIWPGSDHGLVGDDRLAWNGLLFFVADDGVEGPEVWRTDGTPAGTFGVSSLPFESGYTAHIRLGALPDAAFFYSYDADGLPGLWRIDGVSAESERIWTAPGPWDWDLYPLSVVGDELMFAYTEDNRLRIWASDGTAAGTRLVAALQASSGGWLYGFYPAAAGAIFFADDAAHGLEPWVTDGTSAGTHLLADVRPGPDGSLDTDYSFLQAAILGGDVLVALDDGVHGRELWATDGTAAGTALVADLAPGVDWSTIDFRGALNGDELFVFSRTGQPDQLWRTDGTAAGTAPISDLGGSVSPSFPGGLEDAGGLLYFTAQPTEDGSWPWRSDGTAGGTLPLQGNLSGFAPETTDFTALDDGTAVANTEEWGGEWSLIWSSTGESIQPLIEVCYSCAGHHQCGLGHAPWAAGPVALFSWWSESEGGEPWATDGTPLGTRLWKDLLAGPDSSWPHRFAEVGDEVWFAAFGEDGLEYAWRTRGTPGTTFRFARLSDAPVSFDADSLWPLDIAAGSLFFVRYTFDGWELWFAPGGDASPVFLGTGFSWLTELGAAGSEMFFATRKYEGPQEPDPGTELWASDGTPAGTRMVRDIWSGPLTSSPAPAFVLGGRVFFRACEPVGGCELWTSDGTSAGTAPFLDLAPGPASSFPNGFSQLGALVYFAACKVETGCEAWVTDGTVAGTQMLPELAPGPYSGLLVFDGYPYSWSPRFVRSGGWLYFAGDDGTGAELWAMSLELFRDGFETGDTSRWSAVEP